MLEDDRGIKCSREEEEIADSGDSKSGVPSEVGEDA